MLRLFCLLCVSGLALGETVNLNELMDQVLAGVNQEVRASGQAELHIDDINENWRYKWHHIASISGHMNCREGYVKDLASIRRTGDVSMTAEGNKLTLRVALGLGELAFGFKHCQFKAKHLFSVTQHVSASVSSNSIVAQVTLIRNGDQCTVNLDDIHLDNLGRIEIHTGGGILHKIEDKIINWFTKRFHEKVVNTVNQKLQEKGRDALPKADLCNKLPH